MTHSIKAAQSMIELRTSLCLPVTVESRSRATYSLLPIMEEKRSGAGRCGKEEAERGGEERAEGGRQVELEALACCLSETSCAMCCWKLGDAGSWKQVKAFVGPLTN